MSNLIRSNNVAFTSNKSQVDIQSAEKVTEQTRIKIEHVSMENHLAEIEKLRNELTNQLTLVKKSSFDEGFIKGKKSGFEEGEKQGLSSLQKQFETEALEKSKKDFFEKHGQLIEEVKDDAKKMQLLLADLDQQIENEVQSFEPIGLELIYEVLLKMLGSRAIEKKLIEDVLTQCINKCISTKIIKVRVSLQDYQSVLEKKLDANVLSLLQHIEVIPDIQILPGGCIVETQSGNLEARLETQLTIFKNYLLEVYKETQKNEGTLA